MKKMRPTFTKRRSRSTKETADFIAEAPNFVDDDSDGANVMPDRDNFIKEARDKPRTSTKPKVPPFAENIDASTEIDYVAEIEKENVTKVATRDLALDMSIAAELTRNESKPKIGLDSG